MGNIGTHSGLKSASTVFDDRAPSASLDHLKARAAPSHPGAPPEPLRSSPWPQEPASGRPKVEFSPLSTTRSTTSRLRALSPPAATPCAPPPLSPHISPYLAISPRQPCR